MILDLRRTTPRPSFPADDLAARRSPPPDETRALDKAPGADIKQPIGETLKQFHRAAQAAVQSLAK
jgi:hypothetical protein